MLIFLHLNHKSNTRSILQALFLLSAWTNSHILHYAYVSAHFGYSSSCAHRSLILSGYELDSRNYICDTNPASQIEHFIPELSPLSIYNLLFSINPTFSQKVNLGLKRQHHSTSLSHFDYIVVSVSLSLFFPPLLHFEASEIVEKEKEIQSNLTSEYHNEGNCSTFGKFWN